MLLQHFRDLMDLGQLDPINHDPISGAHCTGKGGDLGFLQKFSNFRPPPQPHSFSNYPHVYRYNQFNLAPVAVVLSVSK
jgi:hypothetical protein